MSDQPVPVLVPIGFFPEWLRGVIADEREAARLAWEPIVKDVFEDIMARRDKDFERETSS